jgi:hypothetical protein
MDKPIVILPEHSPSFKIDAATIIITQIRGEKVHITTVVFQIANGNSHNRIPFRMIIK